MESELVRARRDVMKPLLLKLAAVLVISAAGFLVSLLRPKPRRWPPLPPPPTVGKGDEVESGGKAAPLTPGCAAGGLKDELFAMKSEEELAKIINGTITPIAESSGDDDEFLLPEYNQIVTKGFESAGEEPEINQTIPRIVLSDYKKEIAMEQEITRLGHLVWSLRERERSLEVQLLEYYGLKEQDEAVRELQNRVKINTVESQLLSMKLESLQAENQRLRSQAADSSKLSNELEAAKARINLLRGMVKSNGEQAKEKIAAITQKIALLQDREKNDPGNETETVGKMAELEHEVTSLRTANSQLVMENLELRHMLEDTKMANSSAIESPEAERLEAANRLREENGKLKMDIEQLQTDRYADVEELVYLRWINACLRYELRNCEPPPGKTLARDLSKKLSPMSEAKAKQLILEYANSGIDGTNIDLMDFDSDDYSIFSEASNGDLDTSSNAFSGTKQTTSRKLKFFSKLKKLVLGKAPLGNRALSVDRSPKGDTYLERRLSTSSCSSDEMLGGRSNESTYSCITAEHAPADQQKRAGNHQNFTRYSLDTPRTTKSELDGAKGLKGERCKSDLTTLFRNQGADVPEKSKLKKFAEVLKSSHGKPKSHKRPASLSLS